MQLTGRYSIYGPGNLKITTVKEEDAAKYTCKAQYAETEATADASVIVQGEATMFDEFWMIEYADCFSAWVIVFADQLIMKDDC